MMGFLMAVVREDQDSMNEVVYASEKLRGAISLMSAPAAKARCEPVSRIARMDGEASNSWSAALSSVMRGVLRALRALGRLSVTFGFVSIVLIERLIGREVLCPTPGLGSVVSMNSYDFPAHADALLVTVGRSAAILNLEAIGLKFLKACMIERKENGRNQSLNRFQDKLKKRREN
jgi:hypothetical protein